MEKRRDDAANSLYRQTPTPSRPTGQALLTKKTHLSYKNSSRQARGKKIQAQEAEDN
jgi:hypothetical protein